MYSLYVGFVLLVLIIVIVWICAAGYFKAVGMAAKKFFEPFEKAENETEVEYNKTKTKGDK